MPDMYMMVAGQGPSSEYDHSDDSGLTDNHNSPYYHAAPAYRKSELVSAHIFGPLHASSHLCMDLPPALDNVNADFFVQQREDEDRTSSSFSSKEASYTENLLTSDDECTVHSGMSSAAGFRRQLPAASPLSSSSYFYDAASRHLHNPENSYQYQHPRRTAVRLSDHLFYSPIMSSNTNFQSQSCLTPQARSEDTGYASTQMIAGSEWM
ncbi:hypothetical protein V1509DRAFT_612954 [Lipomyces kononenkoae]